MKKVFILCLLGLLMLSACSSPSEDRYEPLILDETGSLTPHERALFASAPYPTGLVPVLVGVDGFDEAWRTSADVDDLFSQLEDSLDEVDFDDFGLLVCISREPRLMQLRLGDYYSTYATLFGIGTGQEYLGLQQSFAEGDEAALGRLLAKACENAGERQHLSWYQRSQLSNVSVALKNALDWFAQPSESFYGKYIARPLYKGISWGTRTFGSWIWGIAWVFFIILIGQYLIRKALSVISVRLSNFVVWLFGLTFSVSTAACAMFLSNGRMEDLLSIQAFGIPGIDSILADSSLFVQESNMWLTGAFVFLTLLSMLLSKDVVPMSLWPASVQRAEWARTPVAAQTIILGLHQVEDMKADEETPYLHIASSSTGALGAYMAGLSIAALFFLPKAVLWTGIAYAIVKILLQVRVYVSALKRRRGYPSYDLPPAAAVLGGNIVVFLFFSILSIGVSWLIDPFNRRTTATDEEQPVEVVLQTVTVRAKTANLRTGPGTNYAKATVQPDGTGGYLTVGRGTLLNVVTEENGWYGIRTPDGRLVFIKASLTE